MSDLADDPVLEIRDPGIDATAVLRRVDEAVVRRRAAGAYAGPNGRVGAAGATVEQLRRCAVKTGAHERP